MMEFTIPVLMLLCVLITVIQWLHIRKNTPIRERIAYISILSLCWILAVLLIINPNLPNPTQWLDTIFRPLAKFIDK